MKRDDPFIELNRLAFEALPYPVVTLDRERQVRFANRARRDQAAPLPERCLHACRGAGGERPTDCPVERVLREKRAITVREHACGLFKGSGRGAPGQISAWPGIDERGDLLQVVLMFQATDAEATEDAEHAPAGADKTAGPGFSRLSHRELEICRMIRDGHTSKAIAESLNIAQRTVEVHRYNIRRELGIGGSPRNLSAFLRTYLEEVPDAEARTGRRGLILVVDDDPAICDLLVQILDQLGFDTFACESGAEALHLYGLRKGEIDLVMLDLNMPEMGGNETLDVLTKIDPEVRVLLFSGDFEPDASLFPPTVDFIAKPFFANTLEAKIDRLLT